MAKKIYDVEIWGRENSIKLSIKGKRVYHVEVEANSKKEAKEIAWENYEMSDKMAKYNTQNDFRFDIELATWSMK